MSPFETEFRFRPSACLLRATSTLTHVELKALVLKGVRAASGLIVLLQNQHPLACFGQERRRRQAPHATADHHRVQSVRDAVHAETFGREGGPRWDVVLKWQG